MSSGDKLPPDIYCDLVDTLKEKCLQSSLLEMWRFDASLIKTATQKEILDAVNLLVRSPWFGYNRNFTALLGGVWTNSSGHIIGAKTAQMFWSLTVPEDAVIVEGQASGLLELQPADRTSLDWEESFVKIVLNLTGQTSAALPNAGRSLGDETSSHLMKCMSGACYFLMFSYAVLMLGKLNSIEIKLYLSIVGILGIGMGVLIGLGLSSALGFPYTPVHIVLPFLCLGIGIDDMFVIVQCWKNLRPDASSSVPEKIGMALQHAGLSITVTSITDILAFGVGAITIIPGLVSFCVCTSLAITAIFLLQVFHLLSTVSSHLLNVTCRSHGLWHG